MLLLVSPMAFSFGATAAEPACCDPIPATPIPNGLLYPFAQKYIGNPAMPNPVPHIAVPEHPFMAHNGNPVMHCDSWSSSTYEVSGPLGVDPQINSTYRGFYQLVQTVTFDSRGRVVAVCENLQRAPKLMLLDPESLDELAQYQLPAKPWWWLFDPLGGLNDTSGGAYFYLDHHDRVVVGTNTQTIDVIQVRECGFELVASFDLSDELVQVSWPGRDTIPSVLPDWNVEDRFWFASRYGRVGFVDVDMVSGQIVHVGTYDCLDPEPGVDFEQFQNSFAVGEDGVYIVSNYALYRFNVNEEGQPEPDWRIPYDRGSRQKPGQLSQGSGTTVTLAGELVIIGDNADPLFNVLFVKRDTGELVCSEDVFTGHEDRSACENSVIAFQHAEEDRYSVIVVNNYGFDMFAPTFGRSTEPGVARIDVERQYDPVECREQWVCEEVWAIEETCVYSLPKLSFANGLVYLVTKDPNPCLIDAWYFTTVDFRTGETIYKALIGTGWLHMDYGAPITFSPDGVAYVGSIGGLRSIRDG